MNKLACALLLLVVLEASLVFQTEAWGRRRWFRFRGIRWRTVYRHARTGYRVARWLGRRKRDPEPNSDAAKQTQTNFQFYDANNDGYLDRDEYNKVMEDQPQADMSHFNLFDMNNDGLLHDSEVQGRLFQSLKNKEEQEDPELEDPDMEEDDLEFLEDEE